MDTVSFHNFSIENDTNIYLHCSHWRRLRSYRTIFMQFIFPLILIKRSTFNVEIERISISIGKIAKYSLKLRTIQQYDCDVKGVNSSHKYQGGHIIFDLTVLLPHWRG